MIFSLLEEESGKTLRPCTLLTRQEIIWGGRGRCLPTWGRIGNSENIYVDYGPGDSQQQQNRRQHIATQLKSALPNGFYLNNRLQGRDGLVASAIGSTGSF